MGDMGDFWDAVKQSSARHKTMVADKRAISAEKQFDAADALAKESSMTLKRHERGYLQLIAPRAIFNICTSFHRVSQISGKKVKLPYYFKSEGGKPWLPDTIDKIVQAYMMRWPQNAQKELDHEFGTCGTNRKQTNG